MLDCIRSIIDISKMSSFKIWFESKFTPIPSEVIDSLKKLVDEKIVPRIEFLKKVTYANAKMKVGELFIHNNNVSIYVGKIQFAHYDNEKKIIIVPYDDDKNKIFQNLLHEIGHAYDHKYTSPNWNGLSDKYQNLPQPPITDYEKSVYVKEPVEFDTIGTNIAEVIKTNFKLANNKDKVRIITDLTNWLRKSNDEFPYISPETIQSWKSKPTLWRKFQERIWNLIQELKQIEKLSSQNYP